MMEEKKTRKSTPVDGKILKELKKGNKLLSEIKDILDKQWRRIDPR